MILLLVQLDWVGEKLGEILNRKLGVDLFNACGDAEMFFLNFTTSVLEI